MRRQKIIWQLPAAIIVSLSVHFLVVALSSQRPVVMQATGDSEILIEALGNSFANLAAGIETPEPVTDAPIEPTPPVDGLRDPVNPTTIEPTNPPPSDEPGEEDATRKMVPAPVETVAPAATSDVRPPETAPETVAERPIDAQRMEQPQSEAQAVQPVETPVADVVTPEQTSPLAIIVPAPPTETVEAQDIPIPPPRPAAIDRMRAEAQIARVERQRARQRERERAEEAARRQQASRPAPGNANTDAQQGQPERPSRPQLAETPRTTATQAVVRPGNTAAASNYPGRVFRKIQRIRQRKVDGSGTVRLQFTIAQNGSLRSIRVFTSSGSPDLDAAAVRQVRRAAPFPSPPIGAQTTFMFNVNYE